MIFKFTKPRPILTILIYFTIIFSSCSPIVSFVFGVKEFKNETKQEFVRSMEKKGITIDTSDVYKIYDKKAYSQELSTNDKSSGCSLLQYRMYDTTENIVLFHADFCSGKPLSYFLKDTILYNNFSKYPEYFSTLNKNKISDYFDLVDESNFREKYLKDYGKYHYYSVMYAGKFALKYQVKKIEAIREYEKKFNKRVKIYYLLIYDEKG